ncbi:hypothetical protein PROVRETT_10136 [Providencia rettgeri DSM 1131]|nr:hypothetical protein PROVRETT_10136 [Providencia rettgeri DSM 1131]
MAMPSSSPLSDINSDKAATLKVAVGNIIDLFYRPDNLPMSKQNAMEKLTFKALPAGEIQVKNPTPYYLPLASLRIDQQPIKLGKKILFRRLVNKCLSVSYARARWNIASSMI